jgi:hypothetical protein
MTPVFLGNLPGFHFPPFSRFHGFPENESFRHLHGDQKAHGFIYKRFQFGQKQKVAIHFKAPPIPCLPCEDKTHLVKSIQFSFDNRGGFRYISAEFPQVKFFFLVVQEIDKDPPPRRRRNKKFTHDRSIN